MKSQLENLLPDFDHSWIPWPENDGKETNQFIFPTENVVKCPKCPEIYCSQACMEADVLKNGHEFLCPGGRSAEERQAMMEFAFHAVETNDIFILASKVYAQIIKKMELGQPVEDAIYDYQPFTKGKWHEVVVPPEDENPAEFKDSLRTLLLDSLELLKQFLPQRPELEFLYTEDFYAQIIGGFEMNNLSIVVDSPLKWFLISLSKKEDQDLKKNLAKLGITLLELKRLEEEREQSEEDHDESEEEEQSEEDVKEEETEIEEGGKKNKGKQKEEVKPLSRPISSLKGKQESLNADKCRDEQENERKKNQIGKEGCDREDEMKMKKIQKIQLGLTN